MVCFGGPGVKQNGALLLSPVQGFPVAVMRDGAAAPVLLAQAEMMSAAAGEQRLGAAPA